MMKKSLLILIILALASLTLIAGCNNGQEPLDPAMTEGDKDNDVIESGSEAGDVMEKKDDVVEEVMEKSQNIVEINMVAKQWTFEPRTINVKEGDLVKLSIESIDVAHGIALPTFGISERLNPGQTVNIEFTADKKGTFSFFCIVQCGSGHGGMRGTLIVS